MKEKMMDLMSKKLAGLGAVIYAIMSLQVTTLPQNQQGIAMGMQAVAIAIAGGAYFIAQGSVDKAEATCGTETKPGAQMIPTIQPPASK